MSRVPIKCPRQLENKDLKSDVVVEQLKNFILENNLSAGDKLPTEAELSEALHVSRASIREAMKTLESSGIIESIQGKGRFLRDFNYDQMLETFSYNIQVHFKDFMEVVQVRKGLEFYFLPLAMKEMDQADFDELNRLLEEMERQIGEGCSYNELIETHALFHKTLYRRMNNKLLDSLISMFTVFHKKQSKNPDTNLDFIEEHRKLIECLRTKDIDRMRVALEDHFHDFLM